MKIYAIIPARSGSKGLPDKNIRNLNGKPLIAYSIEFAKSIGVDKIFCSTDSEIYKNIAIKYGAEVPFLRSEFASADTAMEQHILEDLYQKFKVHNIEQPDIIVWLRPTFVFRSLKDVKKCIEILLKNPEITAARTVCETEGRLYKIEETILTPEFNDEGKSMIRRQDIGVRYKVFSTDVFRTTSETVNEDFLGRKVVGIETSKICGLDIDDLTDFEIVEAILTSKPNLINEYL
jgi:CMP-N,N'-diacetyllegionaminic acid synthase